MSLLYQAEKTKPHLDHLNTATDPWRAQKTLDTEIPGVKFGDWISWVYLGENQ